MSKKNICLVKCCEIFQKSLSKSKNYSPKKCENLWIQNTLSKIPKKTNKKNMNFPNNCLAKSFEIFQKSLAKSKNYSPKNL